MNKPSWVHLCLTSRCNLRCRQCKVWNTNTPETFSVPFCRTLGKLFRSKVLRKPDYFWDVELPSQKWVPILRTLKDWLGDYSLSISGGEPFLRKDLVDIVRSCHENGIRTTVITNGTLFRPDTIEALSKIDSLVLVISLDGATAETHDHLRGVPGTFAKVMDALQRFKRSKRACVLSIATTLMAPNAHEVPDILKLVHEEHLADTMAFQVVTPTFGIPHEEERFYKSDLWPQKEKRAEILAVMDQLIDLKKNGTIMTNSVEQLQRFKEYFADPGSITRYPCTTGVKNFIMNPHGEVLLCWKMSPFVNVSAGPEKIWSSAEAGKLRTAICKCRKTCRILNCN